MTPEDVAWFDSLDCVALTNCRARVTTRHGRLFAIEVWAEDGTYHVVRVLDGGDQ